MKEYFKYRLLNEDGTFLYLNCVDGASIYYDSTSELKQSASITLTQAIYEAIDDNSKIQIIHVLDDIETVVGTFLMSTPTENIGTEYKTYTIDCYSTLWLLSINKIVDRKMVTKGTQATQEIRRILQELKYNIEIEDSVLSTSVDVEWEVGTSYLTIINDLLNVINYTSLFVTPVGNYASRPYINPLDRAIDFIYDEFDDNVNIIDMCANTTDYFDVPNIFVRYVNSPDVQLKAIFENNNPQNKFSTANRPPNVSVEEIKDVADLQTIYNIAKRDCMAVNNRHITTEIQTSINPLHLFNNCIYLNLNGISGKYIEQSWSFDCVTGGLMTHILEKVEVV